MPLRKYHVKRLSFYDSDYYFRQATNTLRCLMGANPPYIVSTGMYNIEKRSMSAYMLEVFLLGQEQERWSSLDRDASSMPK